jgi:hypothetical protein
MSSVVGTGTAHEELFGFAIRSLENGVAGSKNALTSTENAPRDHRAEGVVVELNDEGEHQAEQVVILGGEVETENVTDRFVRLQVLFARLDWEAVQHACLGGVG